MGEEASAVVRPNSGRELRPSVSGVVAPASLGPRGSGRFVSIGAKLGFCVVLVVALASAAAFFWFSARERDALVDAKRKAADMVADLFAASLAAPLDFGDEDAVRAELRHVSQNRDVTRAWVFLANGAEPLAEVTAAGAPREKFARVTPGTRVSSERVEVARLVRNVEGKEVGLAVVQFSLSPENAAYAANRVRILLSCLVVALGSMAMLLVVTRRQVVLPIDRLLGAARKLERGERGVSAGAFHDDEIGRLGRAFQAMDVAIADREDRLARAHESLRELFDNLRQAILVFDGHGRVVNAESRQASLLFGDVELEGRPVAELLYPDAGGWDAELRAFEDWRSLAFDATPESFDEVQAFAPPSLRLPSVNGELTLALEFRPIVRAGRVERVMLLATDETEKVRLEREVLAQGERHARQMAAMRRLVSAGGQEFVRFLEASRRRLARGKELCAGKVAVTNGDFNECFGIVHTLRGEARVLGLDDLADEVEAAEVALAEARQGSFYSHRELSLEGLAERLARAAELVDEAERFFVEASPSGRSVLEQVTVRRPDLEALCRMSAERGGELARLAERVSARSLGELVAPLSDSVQRWAGAVNKRARLEIEGREVLIPERLASVLTGSLTHLTKNAIAHGIEAPEERERTGKHAVGLVRISASPAATGLAGAISIDDDGRGVAGNPLLAAALSSGGALRGRDSFRTAPPTDDAELAGRGVGLCAVVQELERIGFTLSIEQGPSGGSRFSISSREVRP
jgi:two-component system chemotaxis sensor kinase CheA